MKSIRLFLVAAILATATSAFAQKPLGKNMMAPYIDGAGRDVVLSWNSETGKSLFYVWNNNIVNWETYPINLPPLPVSPVIGKVMMVPYVDKSGRDIVLIWDTGTGKSIFYTWNNGLNNWAPFEINMPAIPLPGALGHVMMNPYIDKGGRDVVLIYDTVTGKSVFMAWNNDLQNWAPFEVNLKPISN